MTMEWWKNKPVAPYEEFPPRHAGELSSNDSPFMGAGLASWRPTASVRIPGVVRLLGGIAISF